MITLKEIAAKSKVSIATVSNILNGKTNVSLATKDRVLKIIKESGYTPNYMARSLRSTKTNTIGVIIEEITEFCSPLQIEGITSALEKKGYKLIFENLRYYYRYSGKYSDEYKEEVEKAFQEMLSIKVDAFIFVACHSRRIDFLPKNLPVPVVISYSECADSDYPYVVIDDEDSAVTIIDYLIQKGNKKTGFVCGAKDNFHTKLRLEGCKKALADHKIDLDQSLVYFGNWTREAGYECCKNLLENNKDLDSIFCFNDLMAAGVYDYLFEKNLKPGKDIDVIGFDNREVSIFLRPQLTTMEIPLIELGASAASILLAQLEGRKDFAKESRIKCSLIERESVKK